MKVCRECGRTFAANAAAKFRCCGQPIRIEGPKVPKPGPEARSYAVLAQCARCENWKDGCTLHPVSPCRSIVEIANGGGCLDWKSPRFSAAWGGQLNAEPLPHDSVVITGTDHRYIRGVYFMAWTFYRGNSGRLIAYLDRVPRNDPHVHQMQQWGVEFRDMPETIPRDVPFHQTWRKPACIADALKDAGRVLWLDADTSVNGSLAAAFEHLRRWTFAADHGVHPADNPNGPEVHALFGQPRRRWTVGKYPCAGVVGFANRHAALVAEWDRRCRFVTRHRRDLWRPNMYEARMAGPLKYHDQGILQDLLFDDAVNGETWSHFGCRRRGPVAQVLRENFERPARRVCHYGGKVKPFLGWGEVLSWGDPRQR